MKLLFAFALFCLQATAALGASDSATNTDFSITNENNVFRTDTTETTLERIVLWSAGTGSDSPLVEINDGDVFDFSAVNNKNMLTLIAEFSAPPHMVTFEFDGEHHDERTAPYAMRGDDTEGNFTPVHYLAEGGVKVVTIKAKTRDDVVIAEVTITFTLEGSPMPSMAPSVSMMPTPAPFAVNGNTPAPVIVENTQCDKDNCDNCECERLFGLLSGVTLKFEGYIKGFCFDKCYGKLTAKLLKLFGAFECGECD